MDCRPRCHYWTYQQTDTSHPRCWIPAAAASGSYANHHYSICFASFDPMTYETNPRDFAIELVEDGRITAEALLKACLVFMSHDDVREMLDDNELSPRFLEE